MAVKRDPLCFAYVNWGNSEDPVLSPTVYKVFHVDAVKIRIRSITMIKGEEVEGPNLWVPWTSIDYLKELDT